MNQRVGKLSVGLAILALILSAYAIISLQGEVAFLKSELRAGEAELNVYRHALQELEGKLALAAGAQGASRPIMNITLRAFSAGFVGVGGDIDGVQNPTLTVKLGDIVRVTIVNGEDTLHDFVIKELDVRSLHVEKKGDTVSVVFVTQQAGTFSYFCSVPDHREKGMEGLLVVGA